MVLPRLTEVFVIREIDFEDRTSVRNEAGLVEPWELILHSMDSREYGSKVFDRSEGDFTWSSKQWDRVKSPQMGDFYDQGLEPDDPSIPHQKGPARIARPIILRPKTQQAKDYLLHNKWINKPIDPLLLGKRHQTGIWKGQIRGNS